jgi:outer membrane protein assembly factor BamA
MNVEKAKKRISKLIKKGDKGYPKVSIEYFGESTDTATEVAVTFMLDEDEAPQIQKIKSESNAREDESIQSVIVKIIELSNVNTVIEIDGTSLIS